jgi:hypothetical protein
VRKNFVWPYEEVRQLHRRRHMLREIGMLEAGEGIGEERRGGKREGGREGEGQEEGKR